MNLPLELIKVIAAADETAWMWLWWFHPEFRAAHDHNMSALFVKLFTRRIDKDIDKHIKRSGRGEFQKWYDSCQSVGNFAYVEYVTTLFGRVHSVNDESAISDEYGYYWCWQNQIHRDGGPAFVDSFDDCRLEHWYQHDELHCDNGPAVISADFGEEWYQNGKLHREDGPAVTWADGQQFWLLNGIEYTPS